MLTRVLLHVVKATFPVDLATHALAFRNRPGEEMRDVVCDVDRLDDIDIVDAAGVEWLATRCGIERGSIEDRRRSAVMPKRSGDNCVEAPAVRVGVIDARRHAASAVAAGRSK
jgi:hypothetical protein